MQLLKPAQETVENLVQLEKKSTAFPHFQDFGNGNNSMFLECLLPFRASFVLVKLLEEETVVSSILWMKKLRLREVDLPHSWGKWQSQK